MKVCTVWGNLTSERANENYPTDLFCNQCFESMRPDQEDSKIVFYKDDDDGSYGEVCSQCGKTREEEKIEEE